MSGTAHTLFITQELLPYHATGGMAVLSRDLPEALNRRGWPHSYLLPYIDDVTSEYEDIDRKAVMQRHLAIGGITYEYKIYVISRPDNQVSVFFVEQKDIFAGRIYDDSVRLHRNLVLGDAALALLDRQGQGFRFVHALDQLSALSLACIRIATGNRFGLIFNILSAEYDFPLGTIIEQTSFAQRDELFLKFGASLANMTAIELGIKVSDRSVTSSPAYAEYLADKYSSLSSCEREKLTGIAQGIDVDVWNPQASDRLYHPIRPESLEEDKEVNQVILSAFLTDHPRFSEYTPNIAVGCSTETPFRGRLLMSFIGRFCRAKGRAALYHLIDSMDCVTDVELLFLIPHGAISDVDRQKLQALTEREPRLQVINHYDQHFAELVFAASDYILMPSEQEPGGLCQKMAMRFGSLPVVTPAGGLKSSVIDIFSAPDQGNGFVAKQIDPDSFLEMFEKVRALNLNDPMLISGRRNAMATDVSWAPTIGAYEHIYRSL
jgi:starch synthase